MSKKKLNKKGQQYKKQMQHTKNAAPRIDASKSIYEVDAKVQAYSAGECAEEADVALGVVTGDTEIVNPVTEEVADADPVPVEEIEEEEEYDGEDDNEDLDEDEMCDDEVDEYDEEDEYSSTVTPQEFVGGSWQVIYDNELDVTYIIYTINDLESDK